MVNDLDAFARIAPVAAIESRRDERGGLFEPVPDEELERGLALHVHLIQCHPQSTRGNHVHQIQTEVLCVVGGTFVVVVQDTKSGESAEAVVTDARPLGITMHPGVAHALKNVGGTTGYVLGYSNTRFDPADVHPYHLLE
jgi:dTDP-4-dehydrorhamnose 3,5-epimerase-like enzyme